MVRAQLVTTAQQEHLNKFNVHQVRHVQQVYLPLLIPIVERVITVLLERVTLWELSVMQATIALSGQVSRLHVLQELTRVQQEKHS